MKTKTALMEQVNKDIIGTMNLNFLIKSVFTIFENTSDMALKYAALSILNFVETIKISDTQLFLMTLKDGGDKTLEHMKKGHTFRMYEEFHTFNFHTDKMNYYKHEELYKEFPTLYLLFQDIIKKLEKDSYTLALMK